MIQKAYGMQEYRNQDVMGASPIHLVVMAYDVAINACEQQDMARSTKAISLLRDALNFDYPDAAVGLFRLYNWCLDCIRQGDFASAMSTLKELRDAWQTVEKRLSPPPVQVAPSFTSVPAMARAA